MTWKTVFPDVALWVELITSGEYIFSAEGMFSLFLSKIWRKLNGERTFGFFEKFD
jgi:hypothetical protein